MGYRTSLEILRKDRADDLLESLHLQKDTR